jgi:hypothetical protein
MNKTTRYLCDLMINNISAGTINAIHETMFNTILSAWTINLNTRDETPILLEYSR